MFDFSTFRRVKEKLNNWGFTLFDDVCSFTYRALSTVNGKLRKGLIFIINNDAPTLFCVLWTLYIVIFYNENFVILEIHDGMIEQVGFVEC